MATRQQAARRVDETPASDVDGSVAEDNNPSVNDSMDVDESEDATFEIIDIDTECARKRVASKMKVSIRGQIQAYTAGNKEIFPSELNFEAMCLVKNSATFKYIVHDSDDEVIARNPVDKGEEFVLTGRLCDVVAGDRWFETMSEGCYLVQPDDSATETLWYARTSMTDYNAVVNKNGILVVESYIKRNQE